MIFWILYAALIVVPLLLSYRLGNWRTLLICAIPLLAYALIDNALECYLNSHSEACTWGYLNVGLSIPIGGVLYLIVSAIQYIVYRLRGR